MSRSSCSSVAKGSQWDRGGWRMTLKVFLYCLVILALWLAAAVVDGLRGYLVFNTLLTLGVAGLVVWKRTLWQRNGRARRAANGGGS